MKVKYKKLNITETPLKFGKINAIVGKNNAGKTTLLSVIDSFGNGDTKIFDGHEDVFVEIITNRLKATLVSKKGKNIKYNWEYEYFEGESDQKFNSLPNIGMLSAHPKLDEFEKIMSKQAANFIESSFPDEIKMLKDGIEIPKSLDDIRTVIIQEEGDDYSIEKKFDLSKAINIKFNKEIRGNISNKGLGQIKEYILTNIADYDDMPNPLSTFILLIDEIENSLSIESVRSILDALNKDVDLDDVLDDEDPYEIQVFYSTHNPDTIYKELGMNFVSLGDGFDSRLLRNLTDVVFCEGPTDAEVFREAFIALSPQKIFIGSGGSTIKQTVEQFALDVGSAIAIVDGDAEGKGYFAYLSKIPKVTTYCLDHGTIEDYKGSDQERLQKLADFYKKTKATITPPSRIMDNILEETKKTLCIKRIELLKRWLQNLNTDLEKIKNELFAKGFS